MWMKSIPVAQRPTRQEMIAIADGYFTGLRKNGGKGIPRPALAEWLSTG
jgi:hypothetical protein